MNNNQQPVYDPTIFDQLNLESAKMIVLTQENDVSTEVRWQTETPWLIGLITKHIAQQGLVLDYGCGVGRLSGPLVAQGYRVIGVDTSSEMRQHATAQVNGERFLAVTPALLDQLGNVGLEVDAVLAIWVLQHCAFLEDEIARIARMLKKGGIIAVADMKHRAVPTTQGWINDGKTVKDALLQQFTLIQQYAYNSPNAPQNLRDNAYIAFFQKR